MGNSVEGGGGSELRCKARDLLRILAEAWARLWHEGEVNDPVRLLRAARRAGWLSFMGRAGEGL